MATFDSGAQPLLASRFGVEIDDTIVATFLECSGLSATIAVETHAEGGWNHSPRKFPSRVDYGNLTLKHGRLSDDALYDWFLRVAHGDSRGGSGRAERKTVSVILFDPKGDPCARWSFYQAFPVKWTGPSLQATGNAVAIESIELAHEGLIRE